MKYTHIVTWRDRQNDRSINQHKWISKCSVQLFFNQVIEHYIQEDSTMPFFQTHIQKITSCLQVVTYVLKLYKIHTKFVDVIDFEDKAGDYMFHFFRKQYAVNMKKMLFINFGEQCVVFHGK